MIFENMTRKEQERFLMPVILELLQNLGGKVTRNELKNEIRKSVDEIPETIIDEKKPSKNGGTYNPFNFVFNFSIKNLEMAKFLIIPQRGELQLTEKGIMCDISQLNLEQDVYLLSDQGWKDKKLKKQLTPNKDNNESAFDELDENEDVIDKWKIDLKEALYAMHPKKFETFCRALVKKMGVEIDEKKGISGTRDGGLDGYGYITSYDDFRTTRVAIQAKRWNEQQKVGSPSIDQFRGAMDKFNAEFGIFITTAEFSNEALKTAREGTRAITLISGTKLLELVEKYQIYIKPTYQLDSFYLEDMNEK